VRYLNPQTAPQLGALPRPDLGFNYLGRFAAPAGEDWSLAPELLSLEADTGQPLAHRIDINVVTMDECSGPKLMAAWAWASPMIADEAACDLAERWFQILDLLVRHAAQPGRGGRTPSDLPLVRLSQSEIERFEHHYPQLEDILPLSPLQHGLLFHALYALGAPDVYTTQLVLTLEGPLDQEALQSAAQDVLSRHKSLRASFHHEGLEQPVQVVQSAIETPWRTIDLSRVEDSAREHRLAEIFDTDRARRFDLASAPL